MDVDVNTGRAGVVRPATLDGMADHHGIRVTALGDDSETLLAIGHHEPRAVLRALDAMARNNLGWESLSDGGGFETPADAEAALDRRWAHFAAGCEPECVNPRDPGHWRVYYVDAGEPGAVPVTVLDCS